MNVVRVLYLLVGIGLLVVVLGYTDLESVWSHVQQVGWGILLVLAVYKLAFVADTAAWQLTLPRAGFGVRWFYDIWKVRMVGAAIAKAMPFSSWGGVPVKAYMLKRYHGVGYRESTASLVIVESTHLIALLLFMGCGVLLVFTASDLPADYRGFAVASLGVLTVGIGGFYFFQRFRVTSTTGRWLSRRRLGRPIEKILHHLRDMDERLVTFYTRDRARFSGALSFSALNWFLGAVELYVIMYFLGHPISPVDAVILETIVELVRAGTFFIPATLGTQEAAFLVATGAITGQPTLGVAAALVRRFREIVWVVWGLAIGWRYSERPTGLLKAAKTSGIPER